MNRRTFELRGGPTEKGAAEVAGRGRPNCRRDDLESSQETRGHSARLVPCPRHVVSTVLEDQMVFTTKLSQPQPPSRRSAYRLASELGVGVEDIMATLNELGHYVASPRTHSIESVTARG